MRGTGNRPDTYRRIGMYEFNVTITERRCRTSWTQTVAFAASMLVSLALLPFRRNAV